MAQFEPAFEQMIRDEGGYVLHEVPGDTGGMTYAGIARNKNPQWNGWALVDKKEFGGSLTPMGGSFTGLSSGTRCAGMRFQTKT